MDNEESLVPKQSQEEIELYETQQQLMQRNSQEIPLAAKVQYAVLARKSLLAKPTPKEYIEVRESYPFVGNVYMDNTFKEHFPVYSIRIVAQEVNIQIGWVYVMVEVTDQITGNTNAGAAAHRINIPQSDRQKGIYDPNHIINLGNDLKAALTDAITNAQSKFGVAADVYKKVVLSEEQLALMNAKFEMLCNTLSPLVKARIELRWTELKKVNDKLEALNKMVTEYGDIPEEDVRQYLIHKNSKT